MPIIGAHMLLYSSEPDALRAILRDVFGFPFVDAHGGWLIFALPPAELGVHPGEGPNFESGIRHQISFMCDDIHATVADLRAKGVRIDNAPQDQGWGITVTMTLPGSVEVMLYQPRHALAIQPAKLDH
jgi:catechol 2,3-dioxygenase-like lactoylglutathione lyase family enzyme